MIAALILLAVACAAFSAGYAFRGERVKSQAVSTLLVSLVPDREWYAPHQQECKCSECMFNRERRAN